MSTAEFALGILVGLFTSVVAWALVQVVLSPRVVWSPIISVTDSHESRCGKKYVVKMRNASFFRSVIDVQVHARVSFKVDDETIFRRGVALEAAADHVFRITPGGVRRIRISTTALSEPDKRLLRDSGLVQIAEDDSRSLDDFFVLNEAKLIVSMIGQDAWTGVSTYRHRSYTQGDMRHGEFRQAKRSPPGSLRRIISQTREKIFGLRRKISERRSRKHFELDK